jgi:hypothetical protein
MSNLLPPMVLVSYAGARSHCCLAARQWYLVFEHDRNPVNDEYPVTCRYIEECYLLHGVGTSVRIHDGFVNSQTSHSGRITFSS